MPGVQESASTSAIDSRAIRTDYGFPWQAAAYQCT